jgi:hypothetical protein
VSLDPPFNGLPSRTLLGGERSPSPSRESRGGAVARFPRGAAALVTAPLAVSVAACGKPPPMSVIKSIH